MKIIGKSVIKYKGFNINFNYELGENQRNIIFRNIKTTRQRKFRSIIGYYNEINNIKLMKSLMWLMNKLLIKHVGLL